MPDLKKSMILLIVCICFFMTASCAFAADFNQDVGGVLADVQDCEINVEADSAESGEEVSFGVQLASEMNMDETYSMENITENTVEVFAESTVPETINDLRDELENLKDGDVYNIQKDYVFDRECDNDLLKNRAIWITGDNIVINGNGHTINGNGYNGYFGLFKIIGNNVTLMNLYITNFRSYDLDYSASSWNRYGGDYTHVTATVEWYGDNGVIRDCEFVDNVGDDGGALCYIGNNAIIDSCYFDWNAAYRGGSIFISGYDNTISNTILKDSYSISCDAIYLLNPDENSDAMTLTLKNCSFPNDEFNIGGEKFVEDYSVDGSAIIMMDGKMVYPVVPADSYNELREIFKNLKDGDVYNLTKDYYFDWRCNFYPIMASNVTINGNGHKIYGSGLLYNSLVRVTGDNVTINNLIIDIDNADEISWSESFVNWEGNNGALVNCSFIGNNAEYAGAITWFGDNGLIDGCLFVDNIAYIAAASIYIGGCNNTIRNSLFVNCHSDLLGDVIFIDYRRKNLTLENILFTNQSLAVFDEGAANVNIDLSQFYEIVHKCRVAGTYIDITPLVFVSIMKGGVTNWNDEISFYGEYYNESGDFVFTITSQEFADRGIEFSQSYYFANILNNDFNKVFTELFSNDYETRFTVIKTVYISSEAEYKYVLKNVFQADRVLDDFTQHELEWDMELASLAKKNPLTYALNVIFTRALEFECDSTWNLKSSIYSVLNVEGAGSTIKGSNKDRDEDKWVCLSEDNALGVNNITIKSFNTAIENMGGQCILTFVTFDDNEMDYWIDRDWGAAILNTGIITCVNCIFTDNSAKNGGAIFNQGLLVLQDCFFSGNDAYGKGDDVCVGEGGMVILDGEWITEDGQSSLVCFPESLSLAESTLISVATAVVGAIIASVVSAVTFNPAIGIAVGFVVGAAIGAAGASIIIANTYDVNYDRLKCVLTLSIEGAVSGAFAGMYGAGFGEGLYQAYFVGGIGAIKWTPILITFGILYTVPGVITGITYFSTNV